jgi:hypothetical protein
MNFIKKVFDGRIDESVHLQFQKFSKGEFRNRAQIKVKRVKDKYTISTGNEFANDFVRILAGKLGERKTSVTGAIVSTLDLTGLDYQDKKQFMGIKQYVIKKEISGKEILDLQDKFPKGFFALSFEVGTDLLKIKPKAPKSAKPSTKSDEKIKPDFCKLVTTDSSIGKSFVFEKSDFKDAEITHTFFINELILPQGEKDFAKVREMAKRKGKIVRKALIDGQTIVSEKEFSA